MHYLVARFVDGRVFKGSALDLDFPSGTFRMDVLSGPGQPGPSEFRTAELKALFGVTDLDGDPKHVDRAVFEGPRPAGAGLVRFRDGEEIVGILPDYDPDAASFYVVPADVESNNIWCYVTAASVQEVRFLPLGRSSTRDGRSDEHASALRPSGREPPPGPGCRRRAAVSYAYSPGSSPTGKSGSRTVASSRATGTPEISRRD
jgi:hypothetical protein